MKMTRISKAQLLLISALLLCLVLPIRVTAGQTAQDEAKLGAQEKRKPAAQENAKAAASSLTDGDYVGSEVCITCHQDQDRRFKNTVMGRAFAHPHTPDEAHGCEACHGPGKVHVEA